MSSQTERPNAEPKQEMAMLAALIERSRLYKTGPDYVRLLNFISRMRHMAPFNAALLHMQKPGIRFAATDVDWSRRYNRTVKEGARPLLIMWPFSPVAMVYDVDDTAGEDLPLDIAQPFRAQGDVTQEKLTNMFACLKRFFIDCRAIEYGSGHAGHIRLIRGTDGLNQKGKKRHTYEIRVNKAHDPNVQFATLAHELGHLFLGHLGEDEPLEIKGRDKLDHAQEELEAEMVSYIVCERQGVSNVAESYLAGFVQNEENVDSLNLYGITQAAGRIEAKLSLAAKIDIGVDRYGRSTIFNKP